MLSVAFCVYPVYFSSRNISGPHYSEWQSLVSRIEIWKLKIKDLALDGAGYSWLPAVLKNPSQTRSQQGTCNFLGIYFLRHIPSSLRLNSAFVVCNSENPLGSSSFCWSWRAGSARRMKWNTGRLLGCTMKCSYALTWRLNQGRSGEDLGGRLRESMWRVLYWKMAWELSSLRFGNVLQRPVCLRLCAQSGAPGEGETFKGGPCKPAFHLWRDCRIPAPSKFLLASWLWYDLVVRYQDLSYQCHLTLEAPGLNKMDLYS